MIEADGRRWLAIEIREGTVDLRTQFDPGNVLDAHNAAILAGAHHDLPEFLGFDQLALRDDGQLEDLIVPDGRPADRAEGGLEILLFDGGDHILRRDTQGRHLLRLDPDAHRVIQGPELVGLTYPRHPRQLVLHIDGGEIGQEEGFLAVVGRKNIDHQQQVGGLRLHRDTKLLHLLGQEGQGLGDAILGVDLGDIRVRTHGKGHRQAIGAGGGGGRGHIQHVLDTIDLLLDGTADGAGDGLGIRARVGGVDHDHRRRDVGILSHGDRLDGEQTRHHQDDGDHGRQPWPIDENLRDHGRLSGLAPAAAGAGVLAPPWAGVGDVAALCLTGFTTMPAFTFCSPVTMTMSPICKPEVTA